MESTNEVQVFTNPEFGEIRTITIDGMPWFVGRDVAVALGYSDTFGALKKHIDNEDKLVRQIDSAGRGLDCQIDSAGQKRSVTLINESGLYSLILSSKLPGAKQFKRWVTSEVLPAIRREGAYVLPLASGDSTAPLRTLTPDDYLAAARLIAGCRPDRLMIVIDTLERGGWDLGNAKSRLPAVGSTADIAERITTARDRYRLSYNYIAAHTGISPQTICAYAEGRRYPRPDRYNLICECISDACEAIDEIMATEES